MIEIERTKQFVMTYDRRRRFAVLKRLPELWTDMAELSAVFQRLELAMDRHVSPRSVILIDTRCASPRNDTDFEASFADNRRAITSKFMKVAVLVQTAVGKLQVQRLNASSGYTTHVSNDLGEALAYLGVPEEVAAELDLGDASV